MTIYNPATDEADAIADLWVDLARDQRAYGSHILPEANYSTVRESVLHCIVSDELLAAKIDERLVGFVMFAIETGQYEQDRQRAIVHNLYVVPEYRDQGIGTALLTATEDTFVDSDVDSLSLSVMASNDGAQRFYRRNGYAPHRVELEKSLESDTL